MFQRFKSSDRVYSRSSTDEFLYYRHVIWESGSKASRLRDYKLLQTTTLNYADHAEYAIVLYMLYIYIFFYIASDWRAKSSIICQVSRNGALVSCRF